MSPYHHGALRAALLDAAAKVIAERGPDGLSLRDLARRAGVTHAAPAHHFGDRRGLFTAVAAQGFQRLAGAMHEPGVDLAGAAQSYVSFALTHPGHYAVMFRPDLIDPGDPTLRQARADAGEQLSSGLAGIGEGPDDPSARLAAWALVHGLASLWLSGAAPTPEDPDAVVKQVTAHTFASSALPIEGD